LRLELNDATELQINAEEMLKAEGDSFDGMMTYLTAMEQVKVISKQLVAAEQAFSLVRDRIRNLISRYETMLLKIEAGSYTGASSIVSYESAYYSEYDHTEYMKEERAWARRAMRAEVKAEIAAREAMLAKQQARKIQEEKTREIDALQQKLEELQSEPSVASGDRMAHLVMTRLPKQASSRESVKQRFRDRHKKQRSMPSSARVDCALVWSAGEEMLQQMIFYERSLEAIHSTRMP
jgi:hypothetical protein